MSAILSTRGAHEYASFSHTERQARVQRVEMKNSGANAASEKNDDLT